MKLLGVKSTYIMPILLMFVYIGLKIPFQVDTGQILLTASVKKKKDKKRKNRIEKIENRIVLMECGDPTGKIAGRKCQDV